MPGPGKQSKGGVEVHLTRLREILRDVEIANAILPIVRMYCLSEQETSKILLALHLPRAAGVAALTGALASRI